MTWRTPSASPHRRARPCHSHETERTPRCCVQAMRSDSDSSSISDCIPGTPPTPSCAPPLALRLFDLPICPVWTAYFEIWSGNKCHKNHLRGNTSDERDLHGIYVACGKRGRQAGRQVETSSHISSPLWRSLSHSLSLPLVAPLLPTLLCLFCFKNFLIYAVAGAGVAAAVAPVAAAAVQQNCRRAAAH